MSPNCWTGLPDDLCANPTGQGVMNPGAEFTTRTDSLVGRALVIIADDAGLIPAQSTISMTFLHDVGIKLFRVGYMYLSWLNVLLYVSNYFYLCITVYCSHNNKSQLVLPPNFYCC
jgi:hypothetical protein